MRSRVTAGSSSASPAATVRTASRSRSGEARLSRKPLAPARSAPQTYSSCVEGGQDQDPGVRAGSATSRRVASIPSMPGIRTSIRTTSGPVLDGTGRPPASPSAASADHLEVGRGAEDDGQARAEQRVVVGQHHPDRHGSGSTARSREAARRRRGPAPAARRTSTPARRSRSGRARGACWSGSPGPSSRDLDDHGGAVPAHVDASRRRAPRA